MGGGGGTRQSGLLGHVVHQIVDVEDVTAGEHTLEGGLTVLIYRRAARDAVHADARAAGQLVLGDETHGQKQGVALEVDLGAGDGTATLVHLGNGDTRHALLAVDLRHGVGEHQRNTEIVQTLGDVTSQTARVGHQLADGLDLRALQGHAAGHDEADIARSQNDHLTAGHVALHVHEPLSRTRREDTRRASARDVESALGALAAAHGQHHSPCAEGEHPLGLADGGDVSGHAVLLGGSHVQHSRARFDGNAPLQRHFVVAVGVLGARQLLTEAVESEAVVDALAENTARVQITLQDDHVPHARVVCGHGGRQTGGASADDHKCLVGRTHIYVVLHISCPPCFRPPPWCGPC